MSASEPMPVSESPVNGWSADRLGIAAILLLTFVAYVPAMTGDFLWDDDVYIRDNPMLRTLDGLLRIWIPRDSPQYYPLAFTTFWIEYQTWKCHTLGYHAVNVLLHAVNALLLWLVMRRLRIPGAWLIGALFALHPVNVESVAWITERKNVLSGLFFLLSLLCYLRFDRDVRWRWLVVSLLLFIPALLSKTTTVMLPVVLLLCMWWRRRLRHGHNILALPPYFVLSAIMAAVTIWYERHTVGASGYDWSLAPLQRVCLAGRILWFYPAKYLLPINLSFVYPRWIPNTAALTSFIPIAAAVVLAVVLIGGRPRGYRALLFGLGAYAACLFPVLGFFDVFYMRYASVADHFAYLPAMCFIPLVVGCVTRLATRRSGSARAAAPSAPGKMLRAVAVLLVLAAGALTLRRAVVFRDVETLWQDTLAKNPDAWLAHNNLGNIYLRRGEYARSVEYYRETIRLKPTITEAHDNLRLALVMMEEYEEALRVLREGATVARNNVRLVTELARMLAACPRADLRNCDQAVLLAERVCQASIDLRQPNAEAFDVLAMAYACGGNFRVALAAERRAIRLADERGNTRRVEEYTARLDQYLEGVPYVLPRPTNSQ